MGLERMYPTGKEEFRNSTTVDYLFNSNRFPCHPTLTDHQESRKENDKGQEGKGVIQLTSRWTRTHPRGTDRPLNIYCH